MQHLVIQYFTHDVSAKMSHNKLCRDQITIGPFDLSGAIGPALGEVNAQVVSDAIEHIIEVS